MGATIKRFVMKRNFIDKVFEAVAPDKAVQRYKSRMIIDRLNFQKKRKYEGAAKGRRTEDWFAPATSANMEINTALKWLRQRSRDLIRNNPHARHTAYRVIPNNVIGTGIIPTPKISGKSKAKLNDNLKDAWKFWGEKLACDFDNHDTFYGLQVLITKALVETGECIVRRVRTKSGNAIPLELQVLEGDYIDTTKMDFKFGASFTGEGDYYGIRFDNNGKIVGYWLYDSHPGEFGTTSSFVSAKDVIHIYEKDRPGQIRGVPFNVAVILRSRDLDKYQDAELVRQQVAASFAIFKTVEGDGNTDGKDNNLEHVEPGGIYNLEPGENIAFAQPPVTQNYEAFDKSVLRSIAVGTGVTYEAMTGDLSNVNFSSYRAGRFEFNRFITHLQWNLIIPHFCDRCYEWFVEAASLKGIVPVGTLVPVTWTPPRIEMIDPYKEIQAYKTQLRLGLISWQEIVRLFGYIPEELMEELQADKDMWDKLGLMPEGDPRFDANRINDDPEDELMKDDEDKKPQK